MREHLRGRHAPFRGIVGYPLDQLYEEIAFVASHFHWSQAEIVEMPHWERRQWCEEISRMNKELNERARVS